MALGSDLLALPFAEVVAQLAIGIAEAQRRLDQNAVNQLLDVVRSLGEAAGDSSDAPDQAERREALVGLLERLGKAGLLPTFYRFIDTEVEVRMAISTSKESSLGVSGGLKLSAVTVDASYSQKYSYKAEGSSVLRTKIVPVAPPDQLRELLSAANEHRLLDLNLPSSLQQPAPALPSEGGTGGGAGGGAGGGDV